MSFITCLPIRYIGLSIIDAIVTGEIDREKLANLTHPRIEVDRQTILKSLEGDFRPEHLFTLKQALSSYSHYQQMIGDCDLEILTTNPCRHQAVQNLKQRAMDQTLICGAIYTGFWEPT